MEGKLVLVRSYGSVPQGFLARGRLEAEGIPVLSKGGDGPYRMGPVLLFVPEGLEVQARLVLDTIEDALDGTDLGPDGAGAEGAAD